jgi:hypothetical protein
MGKHFEGYISSCMRCLNRHAAFGLVPLFRSLIFCEVVTLHPEPYFRWCINYIGNLLQLRHNLSHAVGGPHFFFGLIILIGSFSTSQGTLVTHSMCRLLCTPPKNNGAQIETFRFGSVHRILALPVIKLNDENNT